MKADLYSLTPAMMWIADHPTDPWLDSYLAPLGIKSFKFGDAPAPKSTRKRDTEHTYVGTSDAPPPSAKGEQGVVSQKLLDYLATKVKE